MRILQFEFNLEFALGLRIAFSNTCERFAEPFAYQCVCARLAQFGKISDFQPGGPGSNRPGLVAGSVNFRRPSFATPSVDRDVKPLV